MTMHDRATAPIRRRKRGLSIGAGDVAVWSLGITLAVLASWLPWDAYFNAANYDRPTMKFSRDGQVPADIVGVPDARMPIFADVSETVVGDPPPRLVPLDEDANPFERLPPLPSDQEMAQTPDLPEGVDPITTQTIAGDDADAADAAARNRVYTLVRSQGRAALIADVDGIYLVRAGAFLPDGRRIVSVTRTEAGMVIQTTGNGTVRLR